MKEIDSKNDSNLNWKEITVIVVLSICLRYCISLNNFSGYNHPPMYGDMEAQRHWMEITTNLQIGDWYRNTTQNDLLYWGLDYPPLTAFHEYIMGKLCHLVYPEMVALSTSRGIETEESILFIRLSVIISDCLVFIPASILFVKLCLSNYHHSIQTLILLLFCPSLLLIDHAHFQYNSVCLGFVILSIVCISKDWDCLGSFFFVMAIGYKQIALYYSLVFFIWLLRKCYDRKSFSHLICIGCTVICSFALLFIPFCFNLPQDLTILQSIQNVIHRMFPWDRWLFEDKVASFWCTINNIIKLHKFFKIDQLKKLCMLFTLIGCIPSLYLLWRKNSLQSVLYSLTCCSLSFFLFSYQVHEKTILFVLLPLLLLSYCNTSDAIWFLFYSSFSMIPLYIKDNNLFMAIAFTIGFFIVLPPKQYLEVTPWTWLNKLVSIGLLFACIGSFAYYLIPAPARYPDMHAVVLSAISCSIFFIFYLIIIQKQWLLCKCKSDSFVCFTKSCFPNFCMIFEI